MDKVQKYSALLTQPDQKIFEGSTTSNDDHEASISRPNLRPLPFCAHKKIWQKLVAHCDREVNIQTLVTATYCIRERTRDRRAAELRWLARKLEGILFKKAISREIYERAINTISNSITACMVMNKDFRLARAKKMIPPMSKLEKVFMVRAEWEEYVEEDYMTEGAATVHLIKDDRFKYHDLDLKADFDFSCLTGGYKNETEQRRKQMRRGPNNRKIALARYSARAPVEESCMKISMTLCEQSQQD